MTCICLLSFISWCV